MWAKVCPKCDFRNDGFKLKFYSIVSKYTITAINKPIMERYTLFSQLCLPLRSYVFQGQFIVYYMPTIAPSLASFSTASLFSHLKKFERKKKIEIKKNEKN